MRGAMAPRLQLELICARLLLPAADHSAVGFAARLERIEQRLAGGRCRPRRPGRRRCLRSPAADGRTAPPRPTPPTPGRRPPRRPGGAAARSPPTTKRERRAQPATRAAVGSRTVRRAGRRRPARAEPASRRSRRDRRRRWTRRWSTYAGCGPTSSTTKSRKRMTWMILSQNAQVLDVDGSVADPGLRQRRRADPFVNGGSDEILRQALIDVLRRRLARRDRASTPPPPPRHRRRQARPSPPRAGPRPPAPRVPAACVGRRRQRSVRRAAAGATATEAAEPTRAAGARGGGARHAGPTREATRRGGRATGARHRRRRRARRPATPTTRPRSSTEYAAGQYARRTAGRSEPDTASTVGRRQHQDDR